MRRFSPTEVACPAVPAGEQTVVQSPYLQSTSPICVKLHPFKQYPNGREEIGMAVLISYFRGLADRINWSLLISETAADICGKARFVLKC